MRLFLLLATLFGISILAAHAEDETEAKAIFAAGCFWCVEEAFEKVEGVTAAVSGYAGGSVPNPSYEEVTRGGTGHAEAVEVTYDPSQVSYGDLLNIFWLNVDPVDGGGQFCDRGLSYRPALFPLNQKQQQLAVASRSQVAKLLEGPVKVTIETAEAFYAAEEYHQDYYTNNPLRYRYYKWACGRQQRLDKIWGKDPQAPLDLTSGS